MNALPEIQFVETDPSKIQSDIITVYEALTGRKLFPADPVRLFLLSLAQLIIQQRALINDTAKQNLLRYARGDILDHKGYGVDTSRAQATKAATTIRWWLSAPRLDSVIIPVGSRVTPGANLYFATNISAEIKPGEQYVDVLCDCLTEGEVGNGFIPGQINFIVDPLPWVDRAENITESAGGTDIEDDERYRERIRTAPESFSTAGPDGAYEYWAKSANPNILDVRVYSPSDGVVEIRPLLTNGEIPSQEVLDQVSIACSNKKVRPLTDKVQVIAPDQISYNLDLTYWIDSSRASDALIIQSSVQNSVENYKIWQKSKLGRDINPSELIRLIVNAGAKRVEIRSPIHSSLTRTQVAISDQETVLFGGFEDD